MVSTFTPNIQLEEPGRGDEVGVWDTAVNNNSTLVDRVAGGVTTISLNNSNIVLSAAQFQSKTIVFNSTLTGNVTITFPTSFTKSYEIQNICTGNFAVQLLTSAAGNHAIAAPPGEIVDVVNDGTSLNYKNLGRIGSYWDYAGSVMPKWVGFCSVPPYLNCDGSTFSAVTYPALAAILGGTTLPDSRGRFRAALTQGTARLTSANCGIDGNTLGAAGGSELMQIHSHVNTLNDPGHTHTTSNGTADTVLQGGGAALSILRLFIGGGLSILNSATTGITINNANAGGGGSQNVPPAYIGGLTLIRAG